MQGYKMGVFARSPAEWFLPLNRLDLATSSALARDDMSRPSATSTLSAQKRPSSALFGCLGAALVVLFLVAAGGIWLYFNAKTLVAGVTRDAMVEVVEESGLPEADKDALIAEIDRLEAGVKEGRIGYEQLARIGRAVVESPLVGSFVVLAAEASYLLPSGLSVEEKEAGRVQLERLAHGMIEERLTEEDLDSALDLISHPNSGDGDSRRLKERLSDDELRAFLAEVERIADASDLPEYPTRIDLGAELRRIIDETLASPGLEQ
jgi:hypothetical protein